MATPLISLTFYHQRNRIGFTALPFRAYGRWYWLFYRYTEITVRF